MTDGVMVDSIRLNVREWNDRIFNSAKCTGLGVFACIPISIDGTMQTVNENLRGATLVFKSSQYRESKTGRMVMYVRFINPVSGLSYFTYLMEHNLIHTVEQKYLWKWLMKEWLVRETTERMTDEVVGG